MIHWLKMRKTIGSVVNDCETDTMVIHNIDHLIDVVSRAIIRELKTHDFIEFITVDFHKGSGEISMDVFNRTGFVLEFKVLGERYRGDIPIRDFIEMGKDDEYMLLNRIEFFSVLSRLSRGVLWIGKVLKIDIKYYGSFIGAYNFKGVPF